jgi:hypothetical protein
MNLLEIRTEIRRLLAEGSTSLSYVTDKDLNKFINEGIKDACIKGLIFNLTKTLTITTATPSYQLPFNFLKMISLQNSSNIPLISISPNERNLRYLITGKPLYYYITQTPALNTVRVNGATYTVDTLLNPATANGFMYEVTVAGTVGGAPPTYSVIPGATTTDGTATLTCRELMTYRYYLTLVDIPTTAGGGTGSYTLIYNALDEGLYTDTDTPNFPWDKHYSLVYYGLFCAMIKEKDSTLSTAFLKEYTASLGLQLIPEAGGVSS